MNYRTNMRFRLITNRATIPTVAVSFVLLISFVLPVACASASTNVEKGKPSPRDEWGDEWVDEVPPKIDSQLKEKVLKRLTLPLFQPADILRIDLVEPSKASDAEIKDARITVETNAGAEVEKYYMDWFAQNGWSVTTGTTITGFKFLKSSNKDGNWFVTIKDLRERKTLQYEIQYQTSTDIEVIGKASRLDNSFVGWFPPRRPYRYSSFYNLLKQGSSHWTELVDLTKKGSPAGRVYAAIILFNTDKEKATPLLKGMLNDEADVESQGGCIIDTRPVKDLITHLLRTGSSVIELEPVPLRGVNKESKEAIKQGYEAGGNFSDRLFEEADKAAAERRTKQYEPLIPSGPEHSSKYSLEGFKEESYAPPPRHIKQAKFLFGDQHPIVGMLLNDEALKMAPSCYYTLCQSYFKEAIAIEDKAASMDGTAMLAMFQEIAPQWYQKHGRDLRPEQYEHKARLKGYLSNYLQLLKEMFQEEEQARIEKRLKEL